MVHCTCNWVWKPISLEGILSLTCHQSWFGIRTSKHWNIAVFISVSFNPNCHYNNKDVIIAYILIFETYFFLISNILEIKCGWLHTYLVEFQITAELVNDEVNSIKLQISLNGNILHHWNVIPAFPTVCSSNTHQ